MRVGFVTSSYPANSSDPRGIHIHRLATALSRIDVDVRVVAPTTRRDHYELDGIRVEPLDIAAARSGHIATGISGIVPNLRRRPWQALEVPRLLAAMKDGVSSLGCVDVLHGHWVIPGGWAAVSAGPSSVPIVVTAHGGDMSLLRYVPPLKIVARRVVAHASHAVGVSTAISSQLVSLGARPERVSTIPVGVEHQGLTERRVDKPGFEVLYVGGLSRRKSVDTLLKAFASLDGDAQCSLVIAGDGPSRGRLERLSESLELDRVHFLGAVPPSQVEDLMSGADVLVLPSRSEGKPTVVMEAMAVGMPVIATDVPGTRELIQHEVNGLLFTPGNWKELEESLRRLRAEPGLRETMRSESRKQASHLEVGEIAGMYKSIYESVSVSPP